MLKLLKIIVLLGILPTSTQLFAWSGDGHVLICKIAYSEIDQSIRDKIDLLVEADGQFESFGEACKFADRFPRTRPSEHYVNYERDTKVISSDECVLARKCIYSGIKSDLKVLVDDINSDKDRGRALILLGHWIGNIHQPMHVSFADDRGGNQIHKRGTCSVGDLHGVWDKCLVERRVLERGSPNAMENALSRLISEITDNDRVAWVNKPIYEWANESYQIVTSPDVGYCVQKNKECWYSEYRRVYDGGEKKVILMSDTYLDLHRHTVNLRIKQAGVRLGSMISQTIGGTGL